jgi:hypothetical protein
MKRSSSFCASSVKRKFNSGTIGLCQVGSQVWGDCR